MADTAAQHLFSTNMSPRHHLNIYLRLQGCFGAIWSCWLQGVFGDSCIILLRSTASSAMIFSFLSLIPQHSGSGLQAAGAVGISPGVVYVKNVLAGNLKIECVLLPQQGGSVWMHNY